MAFTSGDLLGGYQIVAQLGAGGMGKVYRARDPKLNRDVAMSGDNQITAVDVKTGAKFEHCTPKALFETHLTSTTEFDVAPDGQRFVMSRISGADTSPSITVVLNWNAGVKK